jgi:integrase/recombinase XerD
VFWHGNGERFANVDSDFYALGHRVARKAAQAGREFRRFRFHDLRHYFAVSYLKNGAAGYTICNRFSATSRSKRPKAISII